MIGTRTAPQREVTVRTRRAAAVTLTECARTASNAQAKESPTATAEHSPATTQAKTAVRRSPSRREYRQGVVDEMRCQIEARLPGDVHDLTIAIIDDRRYRIGGWCGSYHVKQMAQHLAMNLVSEGQLVNEIEVRRKG